MWRKKLLLSDSHCAGWAELSNYHHLDNPWNADDNEMLMRYDEDADDDDNEDTDESFILMFKRLINLLILMISIWIW